MSKEFREMIEEIWNMKKDEYNHLIRKYKKKEKIKIVDEMLKEEGV